MRTFVPDRTCWLLLLTALAIRLRNKPTYDKLRVLIINKYVRKSLARKNGNENPIWSWNDSSTTSTHLSTLDPPTVSQRFKNNTGLNGSAPHFWQVLFPDDMAASLVSWAKPTGKVTNSDLEQACSVIYHA